MDGVETRKDSNIRPVFALGCFVSASFTSNSGSWLCREAVCCNAPPQERDVFCFEEVIISF
jgi:hypothetical protein